MPRTNAPKAEIDPTRIARTIALTYLVFGVLWIMLSDRALMLVIDDARLMGKAQTAKGWGFVFVTAVLLWMLVYNRVAAHKRATTAYRACQENFADLFRNAPLPMLTMGPNGYVQNWNQAATDLFGWSPRDVVGKANPTVPASKKGEDADLCRRVLRGDGFSNQIVQRVKRNGSVIDISLSMAALRDQSGHGASVLAIMTDITEHQRIEYLKRERQSLLASSQAMHEVLGLIGHELRTPLAGLRAMSEYLITEVDEEDQSGSQFAQSIHSEVLRLTEMANNMLESARLGSGNARWNWATFDVRAICEEALEIMHPLIEDTAVKTRCDMAPEIGSMRGDADGVRRLVLNLLSNAMKHTKRGEISIGAKRVHGTDKPTIELCVTDTGSGMSCEMIKQLGHAFATNTGSIGLTHASGAGLGLAICRDIAAAHGGTIHVTSHEGEGTCFRIVLCTNLPEPQVNDTAAPPIHNALAA